MTILFFLGPRKIWSSMQGSRAPWQLLAMSHSCFDRQPGSLWLWVSPCRGGAWCKDQSASPTHCGGEGGGPSHTPREAPAARVLLSSPGQHSPLHPVLVAGDVLGIEQLVGGGVLPSRCSEVEHESMKVWATTERQASVDAVLVDVKHELGVLDHVDPTAGAGCVEGRGRWSREMGGELDTDPERSLNADKRSGSKPSEGPFSMPSIHLLGS